MDAAYKAVDSLVRAECELLDYSVNSVSEGIEALATTRVLIRPAGKRMAMADTPMGKVMRSFSGAARATACYCPPATAFLYQLPPATAVL